MKISKKNIDYIKELCKEHKVKTFFAFNSVIRENNFNDDTLTYFIVDFEEKDSLKYTELYLRLREKLTKLLKQQIILIEKRVIKDDSLEKELEEAKVLIYEQ